MIRRKSKIHIGNTYKLTAICIFALMLLISAITSCAEKSGETDTYSESADVTPQSKTATVPSVTGVQTSRETTAFLQTGEETSEKQTGESFETELVPIPFETRYVYSDDEYEDVCSVLEKGSEGLCEVIRSSDGSEVKKEISPPVEQVVLVGTKPIYTYGSETLTENETPFDVRIIYDGTMYDDERNVISEGKIGYTVNTYFITYERGEEALRQLVNSAVTPPTDEIDVVGTKPVYTYETVTARENETAFSVKEIYDGTMYEGESVTDFAGATGFTVNTYRLTYERGEEISRELISSVVTAPSDKIIRIGTKKKAESFIMPFIGAASGGVDYPVTQYFGGSNSHGGIDFGVYYGSPIIAAMSGTVIYAYTDGYFSSSDLRWTYGTYVVIDHGNGYQSYYAHLLSRTVSAGDTVKQGDVIGYSGNTGRVSPMPTSSNPYAGTHLHFEIRKYISGSYVKVDPKDYLPRWN